MPAPDALERLVAADPGGPSRQVAVVDAAGRVGVHTGPKCIAFAGHITGEGVSCQANIMASERVWPAMLDAFSAASGSSLTMRLLDALDAAEREGGDLRGRQSAAILVVPAEGEPWRTRRLAARRGPSRAACPSSAAWSRCTTPTGWPARPTSS